MAAYIKDEKPILNKDELLTFRKQKRGANDKLSNYLNAQKKVAKRKKKKKNRYC